MESGSALSSWAYSTPDEALQKAKKLGNHLNCKKSNDGTKLLQCLQSISAETISISQQQVLTIKVSKINDLYFAVLLSFHSFLHPQLFSPLQTQSIKRKTFNANSRPAIGLKFITF